jgi:hypothetical protein
VKEVYNKFQKNYFMIELKIEDYNKLIDLIAELLYINSQLFIAGIDSRVSKEELIQSCKNNEFQKEWQGVKEELETDDYWKDGKHFGDCTDFPGHCLRCEYETYTGEARERLKNIGII